MNVIQNDIPDTCVMGIVLVRQLCLYDSGDNITDLSLDLLRRPLLQSSLEYTRSRKSEMGLLYGESIRFKKQKRIRYQWHYD